MAFPPPSASPAANFMFQTRHHHHQEDPLPSIIPPNHNGGDPIHHNAPFLMKRSMSFSGADHNQRSCGGRGGGGGDDDDLSDDGSQLLLGERKKRLSLEQVKALEKSFEIGNKLEPERKVQLARALGLQPRQIAIWFQNRRARWKTKQLERDYDVLKKQFEALKADNDVLHAQNEKLRAELLLLKGSDTNAPTNLKKEIERSYWSNGSENSSDINLDISRASVMNSPASSSQFSNKHHFTPSMRPSVTAQLLHSSTRSDLQCFKIDHQSVQQEESFCNMFNNGMEDQHGFWPWAEQQHFN